MTETLNKTIFRYVIPDDDRVYSFPSNKPIAVGNAGVGGVEFWTEYDMDNPPLPRNFKIIGTGDTIPDGAEHCGTAPRNSLGLVWHLYELP